MKRLMKKAIKMRFQNNEIIRLNNCELVIVIKSLIAGDQEIQPEFKGMDRYRVLMNGEECKLTEKFIEMLIKSQIKTEKKKGLFK